MNSDNRKRLTLSRIASLPLAEPVPAKAGREDRRGSNLTPERPSRALDPPLVP